MRVLIVDPDHDRVPPLELVLAAGGAEVAVAPSGSFALTMLEWNRQDVIVSRCQLGDMDGTELCSILRSDPSMKGLCFVLVADPGETSGEQAAAAGIDLVVPAAGLDESILTRIVQLLRRDREVAPPAGAPAPVADEPAPTGVPPPVLATPTPVAAAAAPDPATAAAMVARFAELGVGGGNGTARTFQGSLGVMGMEEITQAIALGRKTGRLLLALSAGGGLVAFESGRVVHAELGDTVGEPAFAAMVVTAHRERSGRFCFIPSDPNEQSSLPRTIGKSVDQLLLSIATAMDEAGLPGARPAGTHHGDER